MSEQPQSNSYDQEFVEKWGRAVGVEARALTDFLDVISAEKDYNDTRREASTDDLDSLTALFEASAKYIFAKERVRLRIREKPHYLEANQEINEDFEKLANYFSAQGDKDPKDMALSWIYDTIIKF